MRTLVTVALLGGAVACSDSTFDLGLAEHGDDAGAAGVDAAADLANTSDDPSSLDSCDSDSLGFGADDLIAGQVYEDFAGDPLEWTDEALPTSDDGAGYDTPEDALPVWCGNGDS